MSTIKTKVTAEMKKFFAFSAIKPGMILAVIEQIGGWEDFTENHKNVINHGAAVGFSGFIYYSETCDFYEKNHAGILNLVLETSQNLGDSAISLVSAFSFLKLSTEEEIARTLYGSDHDTYVANALAWFALEEVCHAYQNFSEFYN